MPGHQCPVQNFYGKYKKQLLSGNMRERKLICSYKFVKGYQSRKKNSSNFLNTKIFQVQESCWLIILFWALLKKLYASKFCDPLAHVVTCSLWDNLVLTAWKQAIYSIKCLLMHRHVTAVLFRMRVWLIVLKFTFQETGSLKIFTQKSF